jgi:membrane protein implicated in regulation of membrane protease activity
MLNPEGHVFIDGALWRARAVDLDAAGEGVVRVGTAVRVQAVDGPVILVGATVEASADAG